MNEAKVSNTGQATQSTYRKEFPIPIRWIVNMTQRLGLQHPHAPHWVIAFLTFLLAVLAYKAWDESTKTTRTLEDQLKATREATEVANRGWISVPHITLAAPIENGKPLEFEITLVNDGKSPVLHANFKFHDFTVPYIPDGDYGPASDVEPREKNVTCDNLSPEFEGGYLLWPGRPGGMHQSFENTERERQNAADAASRKKSLVLEGCSVYTSAGKIHRTAFRYLLRDVPRASILTATVPGPGCDSRRDGSFDCRWQFNSMATGNNAD